MQLTGFNCYNVNYLLSLLITSDYKGMNSKKDALIELLNTIGVEKSNTIYNEILNYDISNKRINKNGKN